MPIWLPSVTATGVEKRLECWGVFEVLVPELGEPTLHVAGLMTADGTGRVSSPLASIDEADRRVVTTTGGVYKLIGLPGLRGNGLYVWRQWLQLWDAKALADATPAFERRFLAAGDEHAE